MTGPAPDLLLVSEEDYAEERPRAGGASFSSRLRDGLLRLTRFSDSMPPRMGPALLATYAARAGFRTEIINNVLASPLSRLRYLARLRAKPRVVGISTIAVKYTETVAEIAALARRHSPGSLIVAGGHGAVHSEEMAAQADLTVTGYGENALVRLLAALRRGESPDSLQGLSRTPGGVRLLAGDSYYEGGPMLFPDWGLLKNRLKVFPLEASRGCRYNCAFCTTPGRRRQVFRPPAEVLAEAQYDIGRHGASLINFVDASFTSDPGFIDAFLALLPSSGLGVPWTCFSRIDDFTRQPGLPGRLRRAGCRLSYLGVESIHDDILERMRKGYDRRTVEAGLSGLEGLPVHVNFIIGFPGETEGKVKETVDFIERFAIPEVSLTPLYAPAELYEQARRDPAKFRNLRGDASDSWAHDTMDRAEAVRLTAWARQRLQEGGSGVTVC